MRARINLVTLAVDDVARSLAFYRDGLGWPSADGVVGTEFHDEVSGADGTIAMVQTDDGSLQIGLYGRTDLAKDAGVEPVPPGSGQFTLALVADSQEEVDRMLGQAEAAGGRLTATPRMRPFGIYCGHFADPDGHLWEVAWNSAT